MDRQDFVFYFSQAGVELLSCLLIYGCFILFSRLVGSRSFFRMTGLDFAVTVALGAFVGDTATSGALPANGILSLGVL